ncbi:hypothetical protein SAMN05192529_13913 [Arachidicoccus rhizosphaerae]|jgi:hypothetical protein|uniref:Uncharacterized protein n=1 Tax=Arachidicoccus rhizosphaerae TaxID=551991 RepID=A0A1H4CY90_9BACT|nr:hypothetical protein [Arachidicoccus rhizosphaerae]SEA65258.1 hypothetical protein SAMN05192529_13913 [Arachidicoccus rhizosphaerae]
MAKLYTSLFSSHLMSATGSATGKKQSGHNNQTVKASICPILPAINRSDKPSLFEAQQQFLDLIEQLSLFCPCPETLNNILNYATTKLKGGATEKEKDDTNYDPQATLSVCN